MGSKEEMMIHSLARTASKVIAGLVQLEIDPLSTQSQMITCESNILSKQNDRGLKNAIKQIKGKVSDEYLR